MVKMSVANTKVREMPWAYLPQVWQAAVAESWDMDEGFPAALYEWQELSLRDAPIYDLSPLSYFSSLKELDLSDTPVRNFQPVSALKQLTHFEALGCSPGNLSFLEGMDNLEMIDISYPLEYPVNVEVLAGLSLLKEVYLNHCGIKSIREFVHLPDLEVLCILFNPVPKEEISWFMDQRPECKLLY